MIIDKFSWANNPAASMFHACQWVNSPANSRKYANDSISFGARKITEFDGRAAGTTNFARMMDFLKDPLTEWKSEFEGWIKQVQDFRAAEQEAFFPNTGDELLARVHRGWVCELIANGERLAMKLIRVDGQNSEKQQQLQFLDSFIENLRSTLETWHPLEPPTENPLAAIAS